MHREVALRKRPGSRKNLFFFGVLEGCDRAVPRRSLVGAVW